MSLLAQCHRRTVLVSFVLQTIAVVELVRRSFAYEGHRCMYCNRKIIVFGLLDADRQRYVDKFKSLRIDKCR